MASNEPRWQALLSESASPSDRRTIPPLLTVDPQSLPDACEPGRSTALIAAVVLSLLGAVISIVLSEGGVMWTGFYWSIAYYGLESLAPVALSLSALALLSFVPALCGRVSFLAITLVYSLTVFGTAMLYSGGYDNIMIAGAAVLAHLFVGILFGLTGAALRRIRNRGWDDF